VSHDLAAPDDETLILRMLEGNKEALFLLIKRHGPKVNGYLKKHYTTLDHSLREDVFMQAIQRVWRYGGSFNPDKGSFKSWFMRIVVNEAIDVISDRAENEPGQLDLTTDEPIDCADDPIDPRTLRRLKDLDYVIEHKLGPLQRAIIKSDLESDAVASDELLARIHHTSKNSIQSSRNQAHINIAKHMTNIENSRRQGGDK